MPFQVCFSGREINEQQQEPITDSKLFLLAFLLRKTRTGTRNTFAN